MNDTAHRDDVAGGLYDFPEREYSIQGRWPSPDPVGVSATCTKNPQTQNRYAYVTNNPLSFVDPLGTFPCNPEDPSCGACDPSTDPLCGISFPIGGGFGAPPSGEGWPGTIAWPPLIPFFAPLEDAADQKSSCKIDIMRPGQNPADMFDWCANNKMKLIWVADCIGGKDCCIDKLGGADYKGACESQRYVYHIQIAAQIFAGWCCRDNR